MAIRKEQKDQWQTMIYKTLHCTKKTKIGQRKLYKKLGVISGALYGLAVPAYLVAPIVYAIYK